MNEKFVFLSEGKISLIQDKKSTVLNSSIADNYMNKLKEINKKNEWKKTGSGAKFMGMNTLDFSDHELTNEKPHITSIAKYGTEKIAYSLNTGNVGGLYIKDLKNHEEPETYILVKEKISFFDIDLNSDNSKLVAVMTDSYLERHLTIVDMDKRDLIVLTEGDSCDSNPAWSRKNEKIIYYDSCGLGYDSNQSFIKYGPKSVFCLNISTGDLVETLTNDKFDFYKPYEDSLGNLYFIKRPYSTGKSRSVKLIDILLAPIKIFKAIFGWLNFFTQRYAGESLKTNGNNPAKSHQKSPEQIFIDGNLLDVENNLKQNTIRGEKNPGYAPLSWELTVRKHNGEEKTVKKGVFDYTVMNDGSLLYTNGKYIIKLHETGTEEIITKAHLAFNLVDI